MLTLPNAQSGATGNPADPNATGVWGILTPKRSQALVSRESNVATREAEVARREAEILAGAPGGVIQAPACPPCPTFEKMPEMPPPPVHTVIKEVFKEESLTPPGWWDQARIRAEDILDRELKIAEREREISRREEAVNRREHDASRRENWIMEQLVVLNADEPAVEEEIYYEPASPKRRPKAQYAPHFEALPPPLVYTETTVEIAVETQTVTFTQHHTETLPTKTVTVPAPANTRIVASPAPEVFKQTSTPSIPRTTSVERVYEEVVQVPPSPIVEEVEEEEEEEYHHVRPGRPRRTPNSWFGW
ncbi:hypothetical protein PHLGIDRAFT_18729 [Phlebiopsis gigantea 11061_1 CR5-6]|uniref:Uncharacterized protein n=1 Tax=Phlebiopsis gigantea (strain 11061_1 CR5-6) TaxID=745531 RepID=A0A0C3NUU3_PHLG1|nr:hypothetical protein PHLGIDRAFT_18729 [Phlebiopsis gigantea 11061_1 CR5-6]